MGDDRFEQLGPLLSQIGHEAANIVGGNSDGIYIYAERGDRWLGVSLYRDEGDAIRYYRPTMELDDAIYDAWYAEDSDKQWSVMEYTIFESRFDVTFLFPDEVDVENQDIDRREIALRKRYGDRPIIYPPVPDYFQELK